MNWEDIWNAIKGVGSAGVDMLGGGKNAGMLALLFPLMQMLQNQMDKSGIQPNEAIGATERMRDFYSTQANNASVPQGTVDMMRSAVTQRGTASPLAPTVTASTSIPGVTATPNVPAKQQLTELMNSMPGKTAAPTVPGITQGPQPTVTAPTSMPERYSAAPAPVATPGAAQSFQAPAPTVTAPTSKPALFSERAGGVDPSLMFQLMGMVTNRNPQTQWANNAMQGQLQNRWGTRSMRQGNMAGTLTPYGR